MQKMLLCLIVILFCSGAVRAQSQPVSEDFPLYIEGSLKLGEDLHKPVIYRYDNAEWEQLPLQDFYAASLSPDGQWLAYTRIPPFLKELLKTQDHQYGTSWDIVLLNLQDNSERIIAAQLETIAATENGLSRRHQAVSAGVVPRWECIGLDRAGLCAGAGPPTGGL